MLTDSQGGQCASAPGVFFWHDCETGTSEDSYWISTGKSWVYLCNLCEYKATTQGILKTHNESVHENVQYTCNLCEYKRKQQGHLNTHIESVHEKVIHIGSVHEKIKYTCNLCEHITIYICQEQMNIFELLWMAATGQITLVALRDSTPKITKRVFQHWTHKFTLYSGVVRGAEAHLACPGWNIFLIENENFNWSMTLLKCFPWIVPWHY